MTVRRKLGDEENELRMWCVRLTMRATRKTGDVPCAADYRGTYNTVAAGEWSHLEAMDVSIR